MKHEKTFLNATVCSLLSLIFYLIASPLIGAFTNKNAELFSPFIALLFYSLFIMILYSFIFIYISYIRGGLIEDSLFQKDEYHGIKDDIKKFLKTEKDFFITVAAVNMGSWLLITLDKLIFGQRTVTAVLLIYAPMNVLATALPQWLNSILGYAASSICLCLIYMIELAFVRKATFNKMYKKHK